ncbi:MAG: hypothetical protein IKS55_01795 [Oscillospiraceae bacterium]|nr:hypothetical protein [Oscillospiraceae bacterium]
MTARRESNSKFYSQTILIFIIFFLLILLILHDLPLTLDDHGFRAQHFQSAVQAMRYVLEFGNGRFFGNGGIVFLMHHLVLGDLVRAAVLAGIAVLLPFTLSLRSRYSFLFSLFLLLTITPGVFGEVYSWMSGFQNYVPPLLLLLLTLLLIREVEHASMLGETCCCFLVFFLGLCMQFYIEHSSCLNVLTAFLLVLWTRKKKCFKASLLFLVGTLIGLACMFYAMLYVAPEIHGEVQSYFSGGFYSIIRGLLRNAVLLLGMYSENAIALCILAALCSLLLARYRELFPEKTRLILNIGMLAPSAVFLFSLIGSMKPFYGKLAVTESSLLLAAMLLYMVSVSFVLICLARHTRRQNIIRAAVLFVMALVAIIPILAVWPTGYRCLFHSCLMLFGAILLLAEEVQDTIIQADRVHIVSLSVAVALITAVLCLTAVFSDVRRMVSIRYAYLEEQARMGADSAAYFLIPSPYIHDVWKEQTAHYTTIHGQQIRLKILPPDVWFRIYYYHDT